MTQILFFKCSLMKTSKMIAVGCTIIYKLINLQIVFTINRYFALEPYISTLYRCHGLYEGSTLPPNPITKQMISGLELFIQCGIYILIAI